MPWTLGHVTSIRHSTAWFKSSLGLEKGEKVLKAVCGGTDPYWITVETTYGTRTFHWEVEEKSKIIYRHAGLPDNTEATCGIPETVF